MGKKSKRNGKATGVSKTPVSEDEQSSTLLSMAMESMSISGLNKQPPRPTEQILGRINPGSRATKKVVTELMQALAFEMQSPSHLHVVEQIKSNSSHNLEIPRTYETDGMITLKQYLLFSSNQHAPFYFSKIDLPSQDVRVLRDADTGASDYDSKWSGGTGLALQFPNAAMNFAPLLCVYMGECYFTPSDLWDYAVYFRKGQSRQVWPDHRTVLLCPFCANLLIPDERMTKYVMIARFFLQSADTGMAMQWRPQLCCKTCFVENHMISPKIHDFELFPDGCEQYTVPKLCNNTFNKDSNSCPDAYTMCDLFDTSGMQAACSKLFADSLKQATSSDFKMKSSKSLSKENRGQMAMRLKVREKKTCCGCGLPSAEPSTCSACLNTYYCSRSCQVLHWKAHKKTCNKDTETEAIPSLDILVNNKPRVSEQEMKDEKNFCKLCLQFKGDTHGMDRYCCGCGIYGLCGPCTGRPEANHGNVNNGESLVFFRMCEDCIKSISQPLVGLHMRSLLREKPVGMHVNNLRLCLAQMMLNDTEKKTGIRQDIEAAKQEYLWLANNLDYAPAQYALATLHDPLCHTYKSFCDGPLPIRVATEPLKKSPFESNAQIAKKYYERACEQKLSSALCEVGTFYKNGNHFAFPQDVLKGIAMLQEAAKMNHTRAMANLARYYFTVGREDEGIEFSLKAAYNGNFMCMFIICQQGMYGGPLAKWGKIFVEVLIKNGFSPDVPNGDQHFIKVAKFYGYNIR